MKIAVDVMGSDLGHKPLISGVIKFLQQYNDIDIILVGNELIIKEYLIGFKLNEKLLSRISFKNANEEIMMTDSILDIRRKNDNSMSKAIECVANKEADAVLTAGATGPFLAANHFILKEITGVTRPAFMAIMPTKIKNKQVVLIDAGANVENDSNDLEIFAMMANIYVQKIWELSQPKVALLNIGTEEKKGKEYHQETYIKLSNNSQLNFVGNIEPNNFMNGDIDIVVTDGFTGNISLKAVEGTARNLLQVLRNQFTKNIFRKLASLCLKKAFNEVKEIFDYRNTGGAILIGVNGIVFKAHGSSDVKAFFSTLKLVRKALLEDVLSLIKNNVVKEEGK
ncbi:phosphate acyltransferase PlsX [Spiroplasma endosymbiont of Dilophus febrilis]|uniref:phosphate acyltransferase PlsX n=1 Tax=Spiroplasma endosymbiont of Dilophus febrilis TaxID=3066292 RepID=UPI00313C8098